MDYLSRIEEAIWFRNKFRAVLEAGRKTGTLRLGRRIPRYEILPVFITETQECIGRARIDVLVWLKFEDIVNYPVILRREFPSGYDQIWVEMKAVYPDMTPDSWVTFYGFTLEASDE